MTERVFETGEIRIKEGAFRTDLELTPIKAGALAENFHRDLLEAELALNRLALPFLTFADASDATIETICEASEIFRNIIVRLSAEEPDKTFHERRKET